MITDGLCNFVAPGNPLSLVAAAGVAVASSVYDELGAGVGQAPGNIIGTRSVFGADLGVGEKPLLDVAVGTAFATSNGATLNVQFQGAVDSGSPSYQPGTWNTLMETGPIAVGNLTAGQVIARFPFAMAFPPATMPRYLRLNFVMPSGENFTAGTIAFATITMVRDDLTNKYAAKNYLVA